jgi:putative tricarboxylic transport membrane protein
MIQEFFVQLPSVLTPTNVLILFATVVLGIIFGALPGLTATLGVALLTPVTYGLKLPTESVMVALLGMYVGAIYGGSHSAIMLNIPGTAASAATAVEGYPLARQGRGGEAIGTATVMSCFGTLAGMLAMLLVIPLLTRLTLQFSSVEFFLLALFGVLICGSLTSPDTPAKGWLAGFLGLLMATVGVDPLQGYERFTFGIANLFDGIQPIPVLLGGFAMPQIIRSLKDPSAQSVGALRVTRILPRWSVLRRHVLLSLRSALIGVGVGTIPGVGEDVAAWMAYDAAKKTSRDKDLYGKGNMEGVIAAESANNACIGGALVPLLTLGVPGSPPAAMLLGAILLCGIRPGPLLPQEAPTFIPQMAAILFWASLTMLICGFAMAKITVWVVQMPVAILMPLVALFTVIGSYALDNSMFNVYLMLGFGLIAYFLEEMGYPIAPLVIGIILGPMADENLRRAILVSGGSILPFFTRPVAVVLMLLVAYSLLGQTRLFRAAVAGVKSAMRAAWGGIR